MDERDSFPFCAYPRFLIDQLYPGDAAFFEHAIEIVHRKADMMDSGTSPLDESADWSPSAFGLQ